MKAYEWAEEQCFEFSEELSETFEELEERELLAESLDFLQTKIEFSTFDPFSLFN